jgi:rubrerythrin
VSTKPSYLGLLNAIAVEEARAHRLLTAWAEVTPSADVRAVLLTVAAREGEHGMSFAKRLDELGFEVRLRPDPNFDDRLAIAASDRTDLDKMELLHFDRFDSSDGPDIFDDFFKDHSIDIATGELLGRYIAEERDSGRRLRRCHDQLRAAAESDRVPASSTGS